MAKEKILVIEDEEDIQELIKYNLRKEGYENLQFADSGEDGLRLANTFMPDIILLDLMLPGMDGLSVCRNLKSKPETSKIAVIMLTAKSEETDVIIGLEMGADDYIPKPFSPKILIARIKAALRRNAEVQDNGSKNIVKRGPLVLNKGKREASLAGKPLVLTFSEFEILYFLARRPGWVYTRNQIVNAVKGDDYPVTERSIDVQVVGLRKKLGDAGELIETVRGVGYRFIETY
jgi:two-component system alkaline phosphatase synthesis response regulator PhoP